MKNKILEEIREEFEIAKNNVKKFNIAKGKILRLNINSSMLSHNSSCKRFLEFLECIEYNFTEESKKGLINKQLDLTKSIKHYNENGFFNITEDNIK